MKSNASIEAAEGDQLRRCPGLRRAVPGQENRVSALLLRIERYLKIQSLRGTKAL